MRFEPRLSFFLVVFGLLFSPPLYSENPADVANYNDLLIAIHDVAPAMDQKDKVREVWSLGHLIELHAAQHKMYSDYDAELHYKLAKDLKRPVEEIRRIRRFARTYPEIPAQKLEWWHYEKIMYVPDKSQRTEMALKDEKEKWTADKLRAEIRKLTSKPSESKKSKRVPVSEDLHTYQATIFEVLDGDTFNAVVDLGFGIKITQKFRMGGLDAPELPTPEGLAAKEFLVNEFSKNDGKVILKSSGIDKYGRWLAEVWVQDENLNQKLIQSGQAKKI